ncbi:MAG: M1 family metallopeptidase [Bacteroidetes bacterium]|nr:M1 family metallopeptidase [Bacteroidota bacterium]
MIISIKSMLFGFLLFIGLQSIKAQETLFYEPVNIHHAYDKETRSRNGKPGPLYWQNQANYKMDIQFNPLTRELKGNALITYFNNSPDTLKEMILHLFPNVYKTGMNRDFEIDPADASQGMQITSLTIGGKIVDISSTSEMMVYDQTLARLSLKSPLDYILPDTTVNMAVSWEYTVNASSHMRTGQIDSASYFIAYFFPRIGVYDDIDGWNDYYYRGTTEFYNDFGNFDVSIELPAGYVVWATGQLQNPAQCLTMKYLNRYLMALDTNVMIRIIDQQDLLYRDFTPPDPEVIWNFKADHVTDFAFALSDHYLWDATSVVVDKNTEQTTLIQTAYDQNSADFFKVNPIAKKAVEYMSFDFPKIPFPYPQVTVFNGLDMMEYPMMVNDISLEDIKGTFSLTAHEIFHNYFPFSTGNNERKYAWMDEGITSFFELVMMREIVDENYLSIYKYDSYKTEFGHERDLPLIAPSELIRPPHYYHNSYSKAVLFYLTLDQEMGREQFTAFLQMFSETWKGKHPTGYDFLYALSNFTSQKFNGLIQPWFFKFGYVDYAIENVQQQDDQLNITIHRKGILPSTIILAATDVKGEIRKVRINPSEWDKDSDVYHARISADGVQNIDLEFDVPIDAYPEDNHYTFSPE